MSQTDEYLSIEGSFACQGGFQFLEMDLKARSKWVDYSKAWDAMLARTHTEWAPWHIVDANIKRHARLNVISHLLSLIPYKDLTPAPIKLPPRQKAKGYKPPDLSRYNRVPAIYP